MYVICKLVLLVTDILFLRGIKEDVADRSNKTVNSECDRCKEDVAACSGGISFGLERSVVDYKATDPTKEKCK